MRLSELRGDAATMASLAAAGGISAADALAEGVRLAVARGTFLAVGLEAARAGTPTDPAAQRAEGEPATRAPVEPRRGRPARGAVAPERCRRRDRPVLAAEYAQPPAAARARRRAARRA